MRFKTSYLVAFGIIAVTVLYLMVLLVVNHGSGGDQAKAANAPRQGARTAYVQVANIPEVQRPHGVPIRGRTEAARSVSVRSETAGVVASTPAREGQFVRRGQVLCRLSVDARLASLQQAQANLRARQLQRQASDRLHAQGFRSETQVLQDQANLDAATAAVRAAQVALEQVNIRAPFNGVFDHRDAEIGAYLSPGQPCGTVIELDPLLIVGDLPETRAGEVHIGSTASAQLVSGQAIAGHVRFVARDADPQTRTYRIEIEARNPGAAVRSGVSAQISVAAGLAPAHLVPSSALVLDATGRQGVRHVSANSIVAFTPVTVIEETPQGVWVAGLTGPVRVIVVGQSYVAEGQRVRVGIDPATRTAASPAQPAR